MRSTLSEHLKSSRKTDKGEDLLAWFGKLVSAEIVSDALRIDDDEGNN